MMGCNKAAQLASEQLHVELDWRRKWALRFHIMMCSACRRYARQLRWLHQHLHDEPRAEAAVRLNPDARQRIVDCLRQAQQHHG